MTRYLSQLPPRAAVILAICAAPLPIYGLCFGEAAQRQEPAATAYPVVTVADGQLTAVLLLIAAILVLSLYAVIDGTKNDRSDK